MTYHCKAIITYEFLVEAPTAENAEQTAHEVLSDDAITGIIRTDIFNSVPGAFPFPQLEHVETKELPRHDLDDPWAHD